MELYGGKVDRVRKDGPRVDPFALKPTESNIYSFVKLLLTSGGAELEPEDDEVIHKACRDVSKEADEQEPGRRFIIGTEAVLLLGAFGVILSLAHRPGVNRYIRIDEMGRVQAIEMRAQIAQVATGG